MQKIVSQMMNRGVPRNRAMLSEILPEASSSICGRRIRTRRVSRGVSRRSATAHLRAQLVVGLAPVLGKQVVEHVVARDHAEQTLLLVHDRQREQVVRGQ